jgi:hypothetical protein
MSQQVSAVAVVAVEQTESAYQQTKQELLETHLTSFLAPTTSVMGL